MKLPGLEAVSWIAAIVGLPLTTWLGLRQLKVSQSTATFASLSVFLLVVLLSYAFPSTEEEENPEDPSAPPSGQALPPGEQDTQTRDPGTPTSDQDAPSTPLCRSDYVATPHAPVEVKPCIALVDDQLEISTEVVSEEPAEVVVWVWLYDPGAQYRSDQSLRRCEITFTAANQTKWCRDVVTPDQPGRYVTATTTQYADRAGEEPREWDKPPTEFTGTQSGTAIRWPS
ncbi:hypothetical protein GU90_14795 [Saccharopolyspora rectivirgula]|uniref:Uncharacterized protein n=1 Tax=Saccharopolyspora rectivirgula TaxID=28042 RepID=A0A073AX24_9PSEU|nr:hypothetical protein GU90_14795 [Saccharopolyspora rectivirgula]